MRGVTGALWVRALALLLLFFLLGTACHAQLPGMEEPAQKAEAQSAESSQAGSSTRAASGLGVFEYYFDRILGLDSPYRPLLLVVLTLVLLLTLKRFLGKRLGRVVRSEAFSPDNADLFMKFWNGVWKFIIGVLIIMALSGSFRLLGLTVGFLGMMLGWSLQQPVTGVAAWLMIILKKPFKIGDRVVIAGVTGDVMSISLTHVLLNQVGGSVAGEERSGRGILIPNAILFQNIIINYTLDQEHMLDEVPVRLTFDSDWDRAKEILVDAARRATKEIIEKTGEDPFIRAEFMDWGVLARLRYNTIPARRQELSTDVIEILLREFGKEYPRVKFAIPSSTVRYRPDTWEGDGDTGADASTVLPPGSE
jgi:small-conductance mechanosensitive channel